MPGIFSASCAACGHTSGMTSDQWIGWRGDDGVFQMLPHPGEFRGLREAGVNIRQAQREGRIRSFTRAVCDNCAAIKDVPYEDAAMDAHGSWWPSLGIGIVVVSAAAVGVYAAIVADIPWYFSVVLLPVWLICSALFGFVVVWYLSGIPDRFRAFWKIAKRETPLPPARLRCETCLAGGLYHLAYIAGRQLRCPSCGQQRYVFGVVGIS